MVNFSAKLIKTFPVLYLALFLRDTFCRKHFSLFSFVNKSMFHDFAVHFLALFMHRHTFF